MPVNRNALIRFKVIDQCLRNRYRKWTLEELVEKVSEALYEFEGTDKGISRRTIQADLQLMRSDKLGYNAPIVVIEKKYYCYEDPDYTITQSPLTDQDLQRMNEAVDMLKQFKGFSHFRHLTDVVQKLEDHVYSTANNQRLVINFDKNENLRGIVHLDLLYQSIIRQKALLVTYQSFKAAAAQRFIFHLWWLKEYRNRWFAVGVRDDKTEVTHLALDRISELQPAEEADYRLNQVLSPETYYQQVIGVTVSSTLRPQPVRIRVDRLNAPYVETKPLHSSQQVIERSADGILIEIRVQLNIELEKEILSFGEGMVVLSPERIRQRLKERLAAGLLNYNSSDEAGPPEELPSVIPPQPAVQSTESAGE